MPFRKIISSRKFAVKNQSNENQPLKCCRFFFNVAKNLRLQTPYNGAIDSAFDKMWRESNPNPKLSRGVTFEGDGGLAASVAFCSSRRFRRRAARHCLLGLQLLLAFLPCLKCGDGIPVFLVGGIQRHLL